MILSWAFIGTIVGLLLGITGAGGAIIAVPLFVYLTDASVRDATILSLIAVVAGAFLNWLVQTKNTDYRLALVLFAFSTLGTLLMRPVKAQSPDWVISSLFIGVAVASLFSIWKKSRTESRNSSQGFSNTRKLFLKSTIGGLSLGGLITMTGLGGGVVIIPFLKGACDLPFPRAAATSLLTIFLSAIFSLWLQKNFIIEHVNSILVIALIGGSVVSSLFTMQIIKGVATDKLNHVRKLLVTFVILLSAGSLLLKSSSKGKHIMTQTSAIHMKDLKDKYQTLKPGEIILDVRTPEEYAEGHVPGAKNINHEDVEKHVPELSKYEKVYVHCRSGKRAQIAVDVLSRRGLKNLVLVKESGMPDWMELGNPVEKKK